MTFDVQGLIDISESISELLSPEAKDKVEDIIKALNQFGETITREELLALSDTCKDELDTLGYIFKQITDINFSRDNVSFTEKQKKAYYALAKSYRKYSSLFEEPEKSKKEL